MTDSALRTLTITVAIMLSAPVHAETYRWVDANGIVNFSERKPRNVPADQITVVSDRALRPSRDAAAPDYTVPSSASDDTQSGSTPQRDLSDGQRAMLRELESAEQNRQSQVAKIRQDNCERARRVLQNLSGVGRIRITEPNGRQRVLPEEERAQRIADAQQGIAANCSS